MAKATQKVEKWILVQAMHLGFVRESCASGTIIIHELESDNLRINGRVFDCTNDLNILKRHGWVIPYTEEAAEDFGSVPQETVLRDVPAEFGEQRTMKVVRSDADLMAEPIDIRHTKTGFDKPQPRDKNAPLEVIRGDETLEQRAKRVAELVRTPADMPVVEDDSLGAEGLSSLNPGEVLERTPEEHEAMLQAHIQKMKGKGYGVAGDESLAPATKKKATRKKATSKKKTTSKKKVAKKARKVQAEQSEAPVIETPVIETPVIETPVIETPVVETPVVETPVVETPVIETQGIQELLAVE